MFINNGKSHLTNLSFEDNLISLNNIDYFKRYIIIENPIPGQMNQITVINISSATGRDSIGIMSDSERFQTTNIYHCYGNVLTFDGKINANSMIFVSDASYGMIDFDYNRPQSFEFMNTVSYTDLLCNTKNFHKLPNIRFYNIAHHMLNEDLCRDSEFENGSIFIQKNKEGIIKNIESVPLRDLIDNHTKIMKTIKSNYNKNEAICEDENDLIRRLTILTIGPVTDLILELMLSEASFCYDTVQGVSPIKYKVDHRLPTGDHMAKMYTKSVEGFKSAMDYVQTVAYFDFRLFVNSTLGNIKLKFIKYNDLGNNQIYNDYEFEIGEFRNDQHIDALKSLVNFDW